MHTASISRLMMKAVCASEMLICLYKTTQCHIPEGCYLHVLPLPEIKHGHSANSQKRITQACEDFAATIIIGEMGYTKCHDSKNVNGFYVSRTDFLQFHIYVIS
jgi:hypothetical protein